MKTRIVLCLVMALMYVTVHVTAQTKKLFGPATAVGKKYGVAESENGWIYFRTKRHVRDVLRDILPNNGLTGLESTDKFKHRNGIELLDYVSASGRDWARESTIKSRQFHAGLRVEASDLFIHVDEAGNVEMMQGEFKRKLPSPSPGVTESVALGAALVFIGAEKYAWQDEVEEKRIREDIKLSQTTYYPVGELIYAFIRDQENPTGVYKLAWRFEITTLKPNFETIEVVVDAQSAKVLRTWNFTREAWGTVHTMYNGAQGFTTEWRGWPNSDYVLHEGNHIHTKRHGLNDWGGTNEVDDNDNEWWEVAASTHWSVEMAWEYYWTNFSRNGASGDGEIIRVLSESWVSGANYTRNGGYDYLTFGQLNGSYGDAAALDVVGHEFTHIVNANEGQPMYQLESGALDESFADIFGAMVEGYVEGSVNWTCGEDTGNTVRSMSNPNSHNQPDTFGGSFWVNPSNCFPSQGNDYCGVHTNSGVQNFWFFLLANGGSGTNDLGQSFSVTGIGANNAARIAYRNLTDYIDFDATFAESREGSINAARLIFGECSQQYISTINAWQAVGVGGAAGLCATQITPSYQSFCVEDGSYYSSFSLTVSPGATVSWTPPYNANYSASGSTFYLYGFYSPPSPGYYSLSAQISQNGNYTWRYATIEIKSCTVPCETPPCQIEIVAAPNEGPKEKLDPDDRAFIISPNPASGHAQIQMIMQRNQRRIITIVDGVGRQMLKTEVMDTADLDLSGLAPGVYMVLTNDSGRQSTQRLIVK